jgi:hypothetical protein
MKVTITDLESAPAGKHPLLSQAQYAAQLAGSSLFFQVMSGLSENPVKVILHDKFSGERKLLVIETAKELSAHLKTVDFSQIKEVAISEVSKKVPPAPVVKPVSTPSLSPGLSPKVAPAPKLVPSGGIPAPKPLDTPKVSSAPSPLKPAVKLTVPPLKVSPSLKK